MRGSRRRLSLSAMLVAGLIGTLVVSASPAEAAATSVSNIHWTKSKLDVARKDKTGYLRVTIKDKDKVCDAAVGVTLPSGRYEVLQLNYLSGGRTKGTWVAVKKWGLGDIGTWRVNVVVAIDCNRNQYIKTDTGGIGKALKVYTSKPRPRIALSSVPGSLTRDARDTATVKLTVKPKGAKTKKVKKAKISLIGCKSSSLTGCKTLGSARTNGSGIARISYKMPRFHVYTYAEYKGGSKASRARSTTKSTTVRWLNTGVVVRLTVTPTTATSSDGDVTVKVAFDRTVCNGSLYFANSPFYDRDITSCVSSVTFTDSIANYGAEPDVWSFDAELAPAYGANTGTLMADTWHGKSGKVTFTVPPPVE